jgi:hypothetical protein
MEIINIEKKAFETMMARFEQLAAKVQMICNRYDAKRMKKWYDNQDVCQILRISPRKLQSLRDSKALPFVKINRKIFYKPEDVQNVIAVGKTNNCMENKKVTTNG